jgi:membrane fusion protein, multidrug efflux system
MKQLKGKRIIEIIILLIAGVLYFSGCSDNKTDSKSMEQLHKENGVPVRVQKLILKPFSTEHTFHSVLSGIKESTASAMVADKVESIEFSVGDQVNKNKIILTFPTDNPAAQYFQAKVAFEHAETTLQRMENLYKNGGISLQDFENTKTKFQVAKANWEAVKQAVKVKAPINGQITQIHVQESDNVNPGDKLFTISQNHKLKARLWISESDINDFEKGATAEAHWNGVSLEGKVVQVDMALNNDNQAFGAVAEFDNANHEIKCGVTADILVKTYTKKETMVIERKNVIKEGDLYYVFVANSGIAEKKQVTVGKSYGLDVELLSGVQPGDDLITEGQMLLSPGSKIKIIEK